MIIRKFYKTREDNVNLYHIYSDKGMEILQIDTGLIYGDVIDVENSLHTYEETQNPIDLGDLPTGLSEVTQYLIKAQMIDFINTEEELDYFNEREPEPTYFN